MATETLNISGWDGGWPTGFVSNVDEPIANADGSTVSTNIVNDSVIFDLTNPAVVDDMDVVTLVSMDIRMRVNSTVLAPNVDVELLIGGVSQGTANIAAPSTTMTTHTFVANVGWWQDWTQAQLNSAQVRLTTRGGFGTTFYLDCIDVVVTYTPIDPVNKEPGRKQLALAGKVPQFDVSSDSPSKEPPRAVRALVGKVPVINRGFSPDSASLSVNGRISYINSQQLRLEPNGWNGTAQGWSGFVTNVDENVDTPDGSAVSIFSIPTNPVTFDFSNVPTGVITNESTVLSVTVRARHRGVNLDPDQRRDQYSVAFTVYIGGIARGTVSLNNPSTSIYQTDELTSSGWNLDWTVAELNSLQVRVQPTIDVSRFDLDAIDVIVEHVPQSPIIVTPARVSRTLTGKVPVKTVDFRRSPAKAAATLSGKTPSLFRQLYESLPYAVRRLIGKTPTPFRNTIKNPTAKTAVLNVKTPLRIVNNRGFPAEVDLTLSGKTPTYEHTQDHFVSALRYRVTLAAQMVAPQDSGGTNTYVSPAAVRLNLVSEPLAGVSLSDNPQLFPPSSAMTVSGLAPAGLTFTYELSNGALTFNGKSVDYKVGARFSPTTGGLSLAGTLPNIDDQSGLLTLTGYAPVMSVVAKPASVALVLAPQDIDTLRNRLRRPGRCPLTITGKPGPTLKYSTLLTPGQPGIISLTVDYGIEIIGNPYKDIQY